MFWVIAVIIMGEIVVLAQLMLSFQKRGARLRVARAPILKRIEHHRETLVELSEKVRTRTAAGLEKMEDKVADFTHSAGYAANLVAVLDNEAHARAKEFGLSDEEEEKEEEEEPREGDEDYNPMKVEKDKGFNPFETVRLIRGDLEDIYEQIGSLRHDEDLVSNMTERLVASNGKAKD